MKPFPLQPTAGTIPANQIVGREQDITKLLYLLRANSVSIEEMRRMGKTLLVRKLEYLCNQDTLPEVFSGERFRAKYFSFQGKQDLGQLIDTLIKGMKDFKEWYQFDFAKLYSGLREMIKSPVEIEGASFSVSLPEFKRSWKEIFFKTLDEICAAQKRSSGKLILIFDELPIMLWEWYKEGKHESAIELLDILRERRQELEVHGIRFIYCGSIGIRVVLDRFKEEFGYTGEPTNDMMEIDLKPFSMEETSFLCDCFLLSGFSVAQEQKKECYELLFQLSNGLPFYTSKLFALMLSEFNGEVTPENISEAYYLLLNETRNHTAFRQLFDRLTTYYRAPLNENMYSVLDLLSKQEDFISEDAVYDAVNLDPRYRLTDCLYILLSDHYLQRKVVEGKRMYKFKYPIFKEWWRINKV